MAHRLSRLMRCLQSIKPEVAVEFVALKLMAKLIMLSQALKKAAIETLCLTLMLRLRKTLSSRSKSISISTTGQQVIMPNLNEKASQSRRILRPHIGQFSISRKYLIKSKMVAILYRNSGMIVRFLLISLLQVLRTMTSETEAFRGLPMPFQKRKPENKYLKC